jgi:pimeloyl-ACP methyl ester carboxylesterase
MVATHRLSLVIGSRMPRVARLAIDLLAAVVRRHPEHFVAHMLARTSPADREVLADPCYRKLMLDSTVEALRQGGLCVGHELALLARPWDFRLEGIGTPVAIWQGLADNIVPPAMARYLATMLTHSAVRYLPNEGHLSLIVRHAERVFADLMHAS